MMSLIKVTRKLSLVMQENNIGIDKSSGQGA